MRRVLAANPRTVVVLNTGAPVALDWADQAPALLQMWFGGQEMANALVDVLSGAVEPGGRLPTTFPKRVEDNPSYGNFPGEFGEVRYGEGLLVGYRWYDTRAVPTRFPFGHGLSYTSFDYGDVQVPTSFTVGDSFVVRVPLTNVWDRPPGRTSCSATSHRSDKRSWLDRPRSSRHSAKSGPTRASRSRSS